MGSVIVIQYVSVDGVVEDPDGSDGTSFGGWAMRHGPEGVAGDKFRLGEIMATGVLLFGRRTWEHFSELWPPRTSDFALLMNAAAKAVVTTRPIDASTWAGTEVVGDLDEWMRATVPARDVVVIGSGSVVRALQQADLVDEYRLLVLPTATGGGRTLFDGPTALELVAIERSGPGTLSTYARTRR